MRAIHISCYRHLIDLNSLLALSPLSGNIHLTVSAGNKNRLTDETLKTIEHAIKLALQLP